MKMAYSKLRLKKKLIVFVVNGQKLLKKLKSDKFSWSRSRDFI